MGDTMGAMQHKQVMKTNGFFFPATGKDGEQYIMVIEHDDYFVYDGDDDGVTQMIEDGEVTPYNFIQYKVNDFSLAHDVLGGCLLHSSMELAELQEVLKFDFGVTIN